MAFSLRRQWLNLALIASAVVLSLVVLSTRDRVTSSETEARARHLLTRFHEDDIGRVTLTRGKETIVLVRAQDDAGSSSFRLTEPVNEPADPYAVDKLLGSLEFATHVRRIEPGQVDRQRFGLNQPRQVLAIDMGSVKYSLRFGANAASPKDSVYVEVAGSGVPEPGVMIVSAELFRELSPEAGELREKQLIPYSSSALERLLLDGAGGRRSLFKPTRAPWRFDGQHGNRRLARAAMDGLLLELARAKAEHFLTLEEAREVQRGAEQIRVELVPRDPKQARAVVTFGGGCPRSANGIVAIRSEPRPLAGCVPKSVFPGLSARAEQLSDQGLIALRADEIERLELRQGTERLALARTPNGFKLESGTGAAVGLDAGNQRLAELAGARGRLLEEPDLGKLGLEPAAGAAELRSSTRDAADGLPDERLRFSGGSGRVYVLREQDGAVLELGAEAARALSTDTTLLRARRVLDFDPDRVREVVVRTDQLLQRAVRGDSGRFELAAPAGHTLDAGLTSDLIEALSKLEVERWTAEHEQPDMGLGAPRIRLTLSLDAEPPDGGTAGPAGSREIGLLVGAPTSGGYYARLTGDSGVFVLGRAVSDRLSRPLLDRSIFLLDVATTQRIELVAKGRKITLEKSGDRFVERLPSVPLRPEQIAEIVDALATLRPEAAVRLGPARQAEGLERPVLTVRISAESGSDRSFRIGAADSFHDMNVRYARSEGSEVSYVIAASKLSPLLERF